MVHKSNANIWNSWTRERVHRLDRQHPGCTYINKGSTILEALTTTIQYYIFFFGTAFRCCDFWGTDSFLTVEERVRGKDVAELADGPATVQLWCRIRWRVLAEATPAGSEDLPGWLACCSSDWLISQGTRGIQRQRKEHLHLQSWYPSILDLGNPIRVPGRSNKRPQQTGQTELADILLALTCTSASWSPPGPPW